MSKPRECVNVVNAVNFGKAVNTVNVVTARL